MSATVPSTAVRLLTIGSVCRRLQSEFPDISISKIRYLEDQGLVSPRRTRGGYRLFSEDDVERLETILRLQRDEFLPLRVIRQELAAPGAATDRRRRRSSLGAAEGKLSLAELCDRGGISAEQARELEEFGLLAPDARGGDRRYPESDADVAAAYGRLAKFGISARNLRKFRINAENEADLLQQLVAPALRSRNPERRQAGMEDLHTLAELAQELSQLLFWRALRSRLGP